MKVRLMHADRDFDVEQAPPRQEAALVQDLELETLLAAMAGEDEFLYRVARTALLGGLRDELDTVRYRLEIAQDCLRNPAVVRELYGLTVETFERKKKLWFFGFASQYPSSILHGANTLMKLLVEMLRQLRSIVDAHAAGFESRAFRTLFAMLKEELSDEYLASVQDHLAALGFSDGVLVSARLGQGNAGEDYVLRRPRGTRPNWLQRMLGHGPPEYTYRLPERDQAGARALSELRDRSLNLVANALAQSADHVLSFFQQLRTELAFHVAGLNLQDRLTALGAPTSIPRPQALGTRRLRFDGLYDVCLALKMNHHVVGNTVNGEGKSLMIITGPNQGGKSTFLRALGLAQLMMQAGLFVGADSFAAELCPDLYTHYKREEDPTMKRGKLDEELARMSDIVDGLAGDAMVLFNESFAATNEREGSEIARQIVTALLERRVKVFFVTHLYDFAHSLFERKMKNALFLRAERRSDGTRTFRMIEGEPLETSYGEDLYREIFPVEPAVSAE